MIFIKKTIKTYEKFYFKNSNSFKNNKILKKKNVKEEC